MAKLPSWFKNFDPSVFKKAGKDLFGPRAFTPSFTDILAQLGNSAKGKNYDTFLGTLQAMENGETDANQLLASMLYNYFQNSDVQSTERNDMFYQYLLQLMNTKDQRAFDLSQLLDSRNYNNPLNELSRLTGAGIGRDAALQLLSGSAGNIGSGVAGSAGASSPSPTGISGTMGLQKAQFGVQTAQAAVAMVNQMVNTGLSLAQGIQQYNFQNAQNQLLQQQVSSFTSTNQVVNALQQLQYQGVIEPSVIDGFSNGSELVDYLNYMSKSNDSIASLVNSQPFQQTFGSVDGMEFFNRYWDSVRKQRDSGTIADQFIRQQNLNNSILQMQPAKIGAEMQLIGQNINESQQRIIESASRVATNEVQIQVLNKQGEWIDVQIDSLIKSTAAQVSFIEAQTEGQDITNKSLNLNYEYNAAGFPMLKQARIDELTIEALKWSTINNDSTKEAMIRQWLLDPENAADAAYLKMIHQDAVGNFAENCPGLYALVSVFGGNGVFNAVRDASEGAGVVHAASKMFKIVP